MFLNKMLPPPFQSNYSKRYKVSSIYSPPDNEGPLSKTDFTSQTIHISNTDTFGIDLPDLFENYVVPHVQSDEVYNDWNSNPMQFWQNQLNFVIWCSTSGCGVSYDHLQHTDSRIKSFYRFHVYYLCRRLLKEMSCPTPFQNHYDAFNNNIDMSAYGDICHRFHVSQKSNWKQHVNTHSNCLGTAYAGNSIVLDGNYDTSSLHNINKGYTDATVMAFGPNQPHAARYTVTHLAQGKQVVGAWRGFIIPQSEGLTDIGTETLNDSMRTFVYCILGAQTQTKTSFSTPGTSLDAKRQFLSILEDCINAPVDLQSSLNRYQDSLQYARSKVDFVVGQNVYMMPTDLNLRIGTHIGYNNEIQIAPKTTTALGTNDYFNTTIAPPSEPVMVSLMI